MICRRSLATCAVPSGFFQNVLIQLMVSPRIDVGRCEETREEPALFVGEEAMRLLFAEEALDRVRVSLGSVALLVHDHGRALVGVVEHGLRLGDDAEER